MRPQRQKIIALGISVLLCGLLAGTAISALAAPPPAGGSTPTTESSVKESNTTSASGVFLPLGNASLPVVIGRIIRQAIGFVGVVGLLMFIYAGILYMTARGNEEQVTKAKNIMLWSILGIMAILGAYGLVSFLYYTMSGYH